LPTAILPRRPARLPPSRMTISSINGFFPSVPRSSSGPPPDPPACRRSWPGSQLLVGPDQGATRSARRCRQHRLHGKRESNGIVWDDALGRAHRRITYVPGPPHLEDGNHTLKFRLASARTPKGSSTLNIEDQTVLYALQQRSLNGPLNLEDAVGFSIYRVSLNDLLYI
jgi:hypothetical protein